MGEKSFKKYLNMEQLMEVVPWSKDTVRRRIRDENFPAIKDTNGYLFDLEDVEIWMKQRKENYG